MILLIGDIHCQYHEIERQVEYAEEYLNITVSNVIQLGDFGVYRDQLKKKFGGNPGLVFKKPVGFIDGNHEDFYNLKRLVHKYESFFTHYPRGTLKKIGNYNFLFIGGASYMDPVNTPPGAVVKKGDIEKCLSYSPDSVDIVVSHDCPTGIGVDGTPGFEYCGETGFKGSREIIDKYKPKLWFFAHHHKWYQLSDKRTDYFGLDMANNGFILLDDNFSVQEVRNSLIRDCEQIKGYYGQGVKLWPEKRSRPKGQTLKRFFDKIRSLKG